MDSACTSVCMYMNEWVDTCVCVCACACACACACTCMCVVHMHTEYITLCCLNKRTILLLCNTYLLLRELGHRDDVLHVEAALSRWVYWQVSMLSRQEHGGMTRHWYISWWHLGTGGLRRRGER